MSALTRAGAGRQRVERAGGTITGRIDGEPVSARVETTEDGFVFRVDLNLRPDGQNGPIVNSLRAAGLSAPGVRVSRGRPDSRGGSVVEVVLVLSGLLVGLAVGFVVASRRREPARAEVELEH